MINIPPIKPGTEIKTELIPDVTRSWKVGQLLNATVERGGEALSRVLLRVGPQQLEARTPVALNDGDQLQLLIKTLGEKPLLSIQTDIPKAQIAANQLRSVIAQQPDLGKLLLTLQQAVLDDKLPAPVKQSLQQLLLRFPAAEQMVRSDLLKSIVQNSGVALESRLAAALINKTTSPTTPIPASVVESDIKAGLLRLSHHIEQVMREQQLLPPVPASVTTTTTTADKKTAELDSVIQRFIQGEINLRQLATALQSLLSKPEQEQLQKFLATAPTPLPPLLAEKLLLLVQHLQHHASGKQLAENLLSLLRNLPPLHEVKQLLDSAVARITSQQLMPLTRDADAPQLLFFDIPVKEKHGFNVFRFRVEQDAPAAGKEQAGWTVTINFDLSPMGPIQARLHLIGEQISSVFHAQKTQTLAMLQQHIGLLEQAYARAGLQVGRIDIISGRPPAQPGVANSVHILDEQA